MPLYNNVIRSMDRKDPPDEGKLGYEFWNAVEELPIIKQIKDWNEDAAQKSEYLNERARSGKEGLLVQGLQAVEDTLGTVVGLPFKALEAGIQEVSDRTNIDPRTFGAIKDIYSYGKSVKASKSGSFYKGVQVTKKNIPRADILNPGQITVKPITPQQAEQSINKVWGYSRFKHSKLPSPIQTAQRRLDIIQGEDGPLGQNLQMSKKPEKEYSNEFFEKKFEEIGLTEDVKFNLKRMLDSNVVSQHVRRSTKMGVVNPDYSLRTYDETRRILVNEFLDGLEFLGIKPAEIEAHHIAGLRQSAQLFEGLSREEFPEMIKLMYDHGLFTGNDPRNLIAIQKKAHIAKKEHPSITAVHTFLNEKLGLYGEKLAGDWGVEVRELSPQERIPYIKAFAKVVKDSIPIAEQAIRDELDLRVQEHSPEAAADASLDISEYELNATQLDNVIKKLNAHLEFKPIQPNVEAMLDYVFSKDKPSSAEALRRRGVKIGKPVQNQLFDLGKKPKKKTKKNIKKDDDPPIGFGSSWDIESP